MNLALSRQLKMRKPRRTYLPEAFFDDFTGTIYKPLKVLRNGEVSGREMPPCLGSCHSLTYWLDRGVSFPAVAGKFSMAGAEKEPPHPGMFAVCTRIIKLPSLTPIVDNIRIRPIVTRVVVPVHGHTLNVRAKAARDESLPGLFATGVGAGYETFKVL